MVASNCENKWGSFGKKEFESSSKNKYFIDIANALEYLHHHCHTTIVHCDLKPSIVLLDNEMIGHVGDFGLVSFLLETTQDCFTNQSSSIGLRGTIGYAPPGK